MISPPMDNCTIHQVSGQRALGHSGGGRLVLNDTIGFLNATIRNHVINIMKSDMLELQLG